MSDPYVPSHQHPASARKSIVVADTTARSGNWEKLQVIVAATFTAIQAPRKEGQQNLLGTSLPAGFEIVGPVTSFTLSAGRVEAHESV
jgi:hypothetical protein